MTTDTTVLRFGPYTAPAVKKGDRAFCLYRDCDVVITGWTDAHLPWPRCRALHHRGGSGLLITDELRRAIVSESAAALKHWFCIGTKAAWNWRRAFGVGGRMTTPGSRELLIELNREKALKLRGREVLPAERERRRQTAQTLDLGRHLDAARAKRSAEVGWTAEQDALLGIAPVAELAAQWGRTADAVRVRRVRLRIPAFHDRFRR